MIYVEGGGGGGGRIFSGLFLGGGGGGGGGGQEFFQLVFRGGLWKISANVTEGFKGGIAKKLQQKPLLCFPPFSRELFVSL